MNEKRVKSRKVSKIEKNEASKSYTDKVKL